MLTLNMLFLEVLVEKIPQDCYTWSLPEKGNLIFANGCKEMWEPSYFIQSS